MEDGILSKISCDPSAGGLLDLYSGLAEALEELDVDLLIRTYLFCPLPPSSYHVTVWDGINDGNIRSVAPVIRSDWTAFLTGLPGSFATPPPSMQVVTGSALKNWSGSISLKFDRLALWGNQVLMARLQPVEDGSKRSLSNLCAKRTELSEEAGNTFGLDFSRGLSPHISLGYFANQEHAQLAHCRVEDWTDQFRKILSDSRITYQSCEVYGFTDMTSFFKV